MPFKTTPRQLQTWLLVCLLLAPMALPVPASEATAPGAMLFATHCASCHDDPRTKAPSRSALQQMPASRIIMALQFGRMAAMASQLNSDQITAIGEHLSTADSGSRDLWIAKQACRKEMPELPADHKTANWGFGIQNQRMLPSGVNINAANVESLRLKWALAFPGVTDMRSQVAAFGDLLYIGTQNGNLLALDQATGCVHWRFQANSSIRSALSVGLMATPIPSAEIAAAGLSGYQTPEPTLFFADDLGSIYAVDARSGVLAWQRKLKWFPTSVISGSLSVHQGRLYVPMSSFEVTLPAMPTYPCCSSHGGVIALDASNGDTIWEYRTNPEAKATFVNQAGTQQWGPSGASVWTTPTIDEKRGVLYIGTGENLSLPATDTSDAIIAIDLSTGKERWKFQALANDVWNSACLFDGPNCPPQPGPDFDFGGAIALVNTKDGKDLLLAGQKSGDLYALDPDRFGEVVWQAKLSQGSTNGGIHWGVASDGNSAFATVADPERAIKDYIPRPGIYALNVADGKALWSQPVTRGCAFNPEDAPLVGLAEMRKAAAAKPANPWPECSYYFGQSAAPVLANGVVYAGALDGKLRALDANSGKVLWQEDTNQAYRTLNEVKGHGGAIDLGGVVPAGSRLFVTSGYSMFGQMPGNVLLAYELSKK